MRASRRPPSASEADGCVPADSVCRGARRRHRRVHATDNEDAASRVRHELYSAFDLLASRPGIGHTREDLTNRPLKFWSVYSYLVAYDPASQPLTIVAVLHGARDVAQILKEIG